MFKKRKRDQRSVTLDRWLNEPLASGPYVPNSGRQYLGNEPAVNGYNDELTKGGLE